MNKDDLQKVRDALLNSAGHHPTCDLFTLSHNGNKYLPCDCGVTESLALLNLALAAEPQQPVGEYLGKKDDDCGEREECLTWRSIPVGTPLYTVPISSEWQGLCKDEIDNFVGQLIDYGVDFAAPLYMTVEKIEAALKAKNSGEQA